MTKTTQKSARRSSKATSSTIKSTRRRSKHPQAKKKFLFACECAMALALFGGSIGLGAARVSRLLEAKTQVLGVSTQLDSQKILGALNLERAQHGLAPLTIDERLNEAALAKGENMFSEDYWAHVSPTGDEPWAFIQDTGYTYQSAGENLARDFHTEDDLVTAWLDSPTHRANILNANFSETGLAVLDGEISGQQVLLVVNLFAQPEGAVAVAARSIYDDNYDGQVLGGELITGGSLTAGRKNFSLVSIVLSIIVVAGVTGVAVKIHHPPIGVSNAEGESEDA